MASTKNMPFKLLGTAVLGSVLLALAPGCGDDDDDGDSSGNPAGVGNHCSIDGDCPTGNCFVRHGIGYCTDECDSEGDTVACPPDTVCKPIQGAEPRCLLVCGSDTSCSELETCAEDYCPTGSSCVDVSDTDLRACEPDP